MRLLKKTKSAILVNPRKEKKQELFADEASAYYTEAILGGKGTVDLLLGKDGPSGTPVPTMKKDT